MIRWSLFCNLAISFVLAALGDEPITHSTNDAIGTLPAYVSWPAMREEATLRAVAASPSGVVVAVGDHGAILRSEDFGQSWRMIGSPTHAGLCDVVWLPGDRWLAVGGGYEPITQISRGVSIVSDDGGKNWQSTNADDVPKLRTITVDLQQRTLRATGDAGESSGIARFQSLDGGMNWVEDSVPANLPDSGIIDSPVLDELAEKHAVSIEDSVVLSNSAVIAVGQHGIVFAGHSDSGATTNSWRPVRGDGRQIAVLFVAASAATTPWAILGRECLEENNRCGLLLDAGDPFPPRGLNVAQADRIEQSATTLGAAFAESIETFRSGATTGFNRLGVLELYRPTAVVLDANLPPEVMSDWQDAIARQAARPSSGATTRFPGVSNVAVSEIHWTREDRPHVSASVLRSDALLPNIASLASDLHDDALMVADPGRASPAMLSTRVLPIGARGIRGEQRGASLTGGLVTPVGTRRADASDDLGSRRRLQITTARLSMQRRIEETMGQPTLTADAFSGVLDSMLLTMSAEDRSRWLWSLIRRRSAANLETQSAMSEEVLDVLLQRTEAHSPAPGLRRWASVKRSSRTHSAERKRGLQAPVWSDANSPVQTVGSFTVGSSTGGSMLSPFQVQPVGYETRTAPVTPVLVPAMRAINSLPSYRESVTRSHWEYHPAVLAARSVATGTDLDRSATPLSIHSQRPKLDSQIDDPCWPSATWWLDGDCNLGLVSDGHYACLVVLVTTDSVLLDPTTSASHRLRVNLDTDGDPMTVFQYDIAAGSSSPIGLLDHHRCSHGQPLMLVSSGQGQIIGRDGPRAWQVVAEIAIELASLDRFAVSAEIVGPRGVAAMPPMPSPTQFRSFVHPRLIPLAPTTP